MTIDGFLFFHRYYTIFLNVYATNRHGTSATQQFLNNNIGTKQIPFEFTIELPPPLRTGIDYGFLPGKNVSSAGRRDKSQKL